MPRIKRIRKVSNPPVIKGFKPYGPEVKVAFKEPVILLYEEYEALRLCDYDMFTHDQASDLMNVSRPTYSRIYASVRQKLARAFVEGRPISIEGGKVYFDSDWYYCSSCTCNFNNPEKDKAIKNCPLCGSSDVHEYEPTDDEDVVSENDCNDICFCPHCGYEQRHRKGNPCNQMICPDCNSKMKRKGRKSDNI